MSTPTLLGGTRRFGISCPVTSLPGKYGCGDGGRVAKSFIDWLVDCGGTVWQVLPISVTSSKSQHSPYSPISAFAIDVKLLDVDYLQEIGLEIDLANFDPPASDASTCCDLEGAQRFKELVLMKAYENFVGKKDVHTSLFEDFESWKSKESSWLLDFALYRVIQESLENSSPWTQWKDKQLIHRSKNRMIDTQSQYKSEIDCQCFIQYILTLQFKSLLSYARSKGVVLMGDIPIYLGIDSADIWAHQTDFELDLENLVPTFVGGVPPDYFSSTGQNWGSVLPKWDKMKLNNFSWWKSRMQNTFQFFDAVRLDHFRGFASYWKILGQESTAVNGKWCEGPGQSFIDMIFTICDDRQIVAEDLGGETAPEVMKLRDENKLRGMSVLQFGWNGPFNPHLPHFHRQNQVVYSGTHDSNTFVGWLKECDEREKDKFLRYAGCVSDLCDAAIQMCMRSVAETCILPISDVMGLPSSARINTPATMLGNWIWKLSSFSSIDHFSGKLKAYAQLFDRSPPSNC